MTRVPLDVLSGEGDNPGNRRRGVAGAARPCIERLSRGIILRPAYSLAGVSGILSKGSLNVGSRRDQVRFDAAIIDRAARGESDYRVCIARPSRSNVAAASCSGPKVLARSDCYYILGISRPSNFAEGTAVSDSKQDRHFLVPWRRGVSISHERAINLARRNIRIPVLAATGAGHSGAQAIGAGDHRHIIRPCEVRIEHLGYPESGKRCDTQPERIAIRIYIGEGRRLVVSGNDRGVKGSVTCRVGEASSLTVGSKEALIRNPGNSRRAQERLVQYIRIQDALINAAIGDIDYEISRRIQSSRSQPVEVSGGCQLTAGEITGNDLILPFVEHSRFRCGLNPKHVAHAREPGNAFTICR